MSVPISVRKMVGGDKSGHAIIIVSSKVFKKATERNLIRRKIKSIFQSINKEDGNRGSYAIIVRKGINNVNFKELKEEIRRRVLVKN